MGHCIVQRYIGRLRQLLASAGGDAASAAGQEIEALIVMRVRVLQPAECAVPLCTGD